MKTQANDAGKAVHALMRTLKPGLYVVEKDVHVIAHRGNAMQKYAWVVVLGTGLPVIFLVGSR